MLARRTLIQGAVAGAIVAGLAGYSTVARWYAAWLDEYGPGWKPMAWPFGRDAFPAGRAWRNGEVEVYVRPKLGFCGNCDTGVVADSEVDQVTDVDLFDPRFEPHSEGKRIRITDLFGRARLYKVKGRDGKPTLAEGIAVSMNCDLVVAMVVGKIEDEAVRKEAHLFIESNAVQIWLNKILEGR
jgi:hypothetical protein